MTFVERNDYNKDLSTMEVDLADDYDFLLMKDVTRDGLY